MSTYEFWCIGTLIISLLNTLGRAVEQFAVCVAKQTKVEVKVQVMHSQCSKAGEMAGICDTYIYLW